MKNENAKIRDEVRRIIGMEMLTFYWYMRASGYGKTDKFKPPTKSDVKFELNSWPTFVKHVEIAANSAMEVFEREYPSTNQ